MLRTEEPPPPVRTVVALSRSLSIGDITVDTALSETNQRGGRSLQTYSDHGISDSSGPFKRNQDVSTNSRVDKTADARLDNYSNLKKPDTTGSANAKHIAYNVKPSDQPIEEENKRAVVRSSNAPTLASLHSLVSTALLDGESAARTCSTIPFYRSEQDTCSTTEAATRFASPSPDELGDACGFRFDLLAANVSRENDNCHLSSLDLPQSEHESVYLALSVQEDEWLLLALERSMDDFNRG
jgi:hypothetical protein